MNKKGFLALLMNPIFLLLLVAVGLVILFASNGRLQIFHSDNAEDDCMNDMGMSYLCWSDSPIDFSTFEASDLRTLKTNAYNQGPPAMFMHARNGFFFTSGNDLKWGNGVKGGMAIIESVDYGKVRGWAPTGGGNPEAIMEYPHKYQVYFRQNIWASEYEVVYGVDAVAMRMRIKCENAAGCQNIGFEAKTYDNAVNGPAEYGDYGGLYGFKSNVQYDGAGWASPDHVTDFYYLLNIEPDRHSSSGSTGRVEFDLSNGETKDIIWVITTSEGLQSAQGIASDFDSFELEAQESFEDYANGFEKPAGNTDEQRLYYAAVYGIYTSIMPSWGSLSHSYSVPQLAGYRYNEARGYNSGQSRYNGQWVWDSGFAMLGLVTGCESGLCVDDFESVQDNWIDSTRSDGSTAWCREIHSDGDGILQTNCPINPPGIWSMLSYKHYVDQGGRDRLCEAYDHLASNNEALKRDRDGDNDYLFRAGAGEMGRDGTDVGFDGEVPTMTGWMMLDYYYLGKIAEICEPSKVNFYQGELEKTRAAYESSFWFSQYNTYAHFGKNNQVLEETNGVPSDNPLSLAMAGIFDTSGGSKDLAILSRFQNGFEDTYFPTSISTQHHCYSPNGERVDGCESGGTWDGPVWPQDEFLMNEMLMEMIQRDVPGAQEYHERFVAQTLQLYQTLPFPAESYDSEYGQSALWGSFPHSSNSGYIIYQITGQRMIDVDLEAPSCVEDWVCNDWSECSDNTQTRTCTERSDCGTESYMPPTIQECTDSCTPQYVCGDWSECIGGEQSRSCSDDNNCGLIVPSSLLTQTCNVEIEQKSFIARLFESIIEFIKKIFGV